MMKMNNFVVKKKSSEVSVMNVSTTKMNFSSLPTRLIADTSKPFRVSLSHFPFVCDLHGGFSIGEPGASPSRKIC